MLLVSLSAMFGIGCRNAPAPDSHPPPVILTIKPDTASASTGTPTGLRFAIQVGAFEKKDDADKLAFQLSNRYQEPVFVAPTKVGDHEFYRVRI